MPCDFLLTEPQKPSGVVVEDIDNTTGKGRIRVGSDEWRALSDNDEIYKKDTIIKVIRIDGTKAVVKPMKKED